MSVPSVLKKLIAYFYRLPKELVRKTPLALRRFYYLAALFTILITISDRPMFLETLNHFRFQYVIMMLIGWIFIRPLSIKFILIGLTVVLLNIPHLTYFYLSTHSSSPAEANIRIMLSNVFQINDNYDSVASLIRNETPDILVIQELTPAWFSALQPELDKYDYKSTVVLEGDFGMGVFSRLPIEKGGAVLLTADSPPSIDLVLRLGERRFRLLSAHSWPPVTPRNFQRRNSQLATIGNSIKGNSGQPTILVGDLNITPFSPYFKDLLDTSSLVDSRIGKGFLPTCPTFIPIIWLPCDHILSTRDFDLVDLRKGPYIGSDHWPLIADYKL